MNKSLLFFCLLPVFQMFAQKRSAVEQFVSSPFMQGASVSFMVTEAGRDSALYSYDADREVIPASVMKTVTTATALELLGADYRYSTEISYDGVIQDSVLHGNIFICGSGDPSLGSAELKDPVRDAVFREWVSAVKNVGIKAVTGAVIADESVFDTEGVSMKWLREDLGSYYGQGCYGINVFDNSFSLFINTERNKPVIERTEPSMPDMRFHNYLKTGGKDSCYIVGHPYSSERWLYGVVPAGRAAYRLDGDIPDPPLYSAWLLNEMLSLSGISVTGKPSCYRILKEDSAGYQYEEQNNFADSSISVPPHSVFNDDTSRKVLITTYSRPLKDLIRITNNVSSNLYADAFLKTIGLRCTESVSSFEKGAYILHKHWNDKGFDTSPLWMSDGSGLAPTDKLSARFLCRVLSYMATKSPNSKDFIQSLPRVGEEGTVRNFLKGSALQGKARLKSGSMSRVRSYAGYVEKDGKIYVVAVIINNFHCSQSAMRLEIEKLLKNLF